MATEIKKTAPKGKKGYTINYRHPVVKDRDGKYGLKIHRGLGTTDPEEADKLVAQLQELVDDETWWDYSKRKEAYSHYDSIVVDAFLMQWSRLKARKKSIWTRYCFLKSMKGQRTSHC